MKDAFNEFSRATAATPESVENVMRRLPQDGAEAHASRRLFRMLPGAPRGAEGRVLARLRAGKPAARSYAPPLVAAAAALTLLVMSVHAWWSEAAPVGATLAGSEWTDLAPTDLVTLHYLGEGTLMGTRSAPRIQWQRGTLQVEVTPNRGIALTVETSEGEVAVVGTAFSVTRDVLGTAVRVSHGAVAVRCADGRSASVTAAGPFTCAPTTPAGLLARARAMGETPGNEQAVIEAAERGLAGGAPPAIRAELALVRAQALSVLSRHEEAYAVAREALGYDAGARQEDLLHVAVHAGWRSAGCVAALPHLEALREHGTARAIELVMLADCVAAVNPEEARSSLVEALRLGVPADQQAAVSARLHQLEGGKP